MAIIGAKKPKTNHRAILLLRDAARYAEIDANQTPKNKIETQLL
ncbi:TPA_asm: hypothetical protein [Pseudomonas phage vB_PaeS-D14Q]|nr:TPA_asm: hypothetical protein [Pseudomonas phage vB_PaeS-D14Q]